MENRLLQELCQRLWEKSVDSIIIRKKVPLWKLCLEFLHHIYRLLHVEHSYEFYRIENDIVYVTDIYNEREDFMWEMFRVNLRKQESVDFWGE